MNEYNISDYGIFSDAVSSTNDCSSKVTIAKDGVNECKTIIGDDGVFMASAVAFVINYACYFSEIYRGGIEGVPKGQQEAGQVLGMTKSQIFFKVTLLQMVKRIVPPMSNEIITLVKDTSIARIIGWQELIWAGYGFLKSSHGYAGLIWPLLFTGVYYLLFNGLLTLLFGYIEKKMSYFN